MTIGSPPPAVSSRLHSKKIPIKSTATMFAVRRYSLPQGFPARAREFSASTTWREHTIHVEKKPILWSDDKGRLECTEELYLSDDAVTEVYSTHTAHV